ncbi:MAG: GntR family transcriptional regulator [Bacteroidales bacterium]|nr:GntR family transcriptional regulator [Bacteroidales bacterium]
MEEFHFSANSFSPLYRQFMDYVKRGIKRGEFPKGKALPSIHGMMIRTGISRETIVKGYAVLCREGVLTPHKGKGYFVKDSFLSGRQSVMVFMDKMSQHQQDVIDGFMDAVGAQADVTISLHYQNLEWFARSLEESIGRYDWYVLFPHFPLDAVSSSEAARLIAKIPLERLIVLDHLPAGLSPVSGAVFQSIGEDVPGALVSALEDVKKYRRLKYISLSVSLYGDLVADAITRFGRDYGVPAEVLQAIPEKVEKGDLYFVSGSRLDRKLSELLRAMSASGLAPGKDIGLICYNDFPLNEWIFGGLTTLSVDFREMGRIAGGMLLEGRLSQLQCTASLIRRNTF